MLSLLLLCCALLLCFMLLFAFVLVGDSKVVCFFNIFSMFLDFKIFCLILAVHKKKKETIGIICPEYSIVQAYIQKFESSDNRIVSSQPLVALGLKLLCNKSLVRTTSPNSETLGSKLHFCFISFQSYWRRMLKMPCQVWKPRQPRRKGRRGRRKRRGAVATSPGSFQQTVKTCVLRVWPPGSTAWCCRVWFLNCTRPSQKRCGGTALQRPPLQILEGQS